MDLGTKYEKPKKHLLGKWVQLRETNEMVKVVKADYNKGKLEIILRGSASICKFSDVTNIKKTYNSTLAKWQKMISKKKKQTHWNSKLTENGKIRYLWNASRDYLTELEWSEIEKCWHEGFDQNYRAFEEIIETAIRARIK